MKYFKMFEREERVQAMSRELNRILAGKSALEKALLIAGSLRRVYGGEWVINYEPATALSGLRGGSCRAIRRRLREVGPRIDAKATAGHSQR